MREDTEIAETLDGIDIIINGHSHILMDQAVKVKNTIIHMAGCYGEYLGRLEFEFDRLIKSYKAENINVNDAKMDDEIVSCIKRNKEIAISKLSEPLYDIENDLWHDIVEESPIINLLADSLKDKLKCELSIINSGILNGGIRKGAVSRKKLLEICPSPLNPTYMEVQGRQIKKALEQSLNNEYCLLDGKGAGFRGKYLGKLHLSGGYVVHNGKNIISIVVGNNELEEDRWYTVATSDYLQRGTGYSSLSDNKNVKYNPEYLRHTLEEYLQKSQIVNCAFKDRWIKID
jgi:2',3'-cyclic-nucleotide 2'-phosphodiesterase (5'-nucleotidase family)